MVHGPDGNDLPKPFRNGVPGAIQPGMAHLPPCPCLEPSGAGAGSTCTGTSGLVTAPPGWSSKATVTQ